MGTIVVNMRNGEAYDVRIDRRTAFGNPFRMADQSEQERERVVVAYREWLVTSRSRQAAWIRDHLHELKGKKLGCWCYPLLCHGDVLVAACEHGLDSIR